MMLMMMSAAERRSIKRSPRMAPGQHQQQDAQRRRRPDPNRRRRSSAALPVEHLVKDLVPAQPCVPKRVSRIEFGVASIDMARRMSSVEIAVRNLYDGASGQPAAFGCLDRRLGISTKTDTCETCGLDLQRCVGHFGFIQLHLPVFHIGYVKQVIDILQCICKTCSAILLGPEAKKAAIKRVRRVPFDDRLAKEVVFKAAVHLPCKKIRHCSVCGAENGPVKKLRGAFKIVHDCFKFKSSDDAEAHFRAGFREAIATNDEVEQFLSKGVHDLSPIVVLRLFERIPDTDLVLLNMTGRPEDLIVRQLIVPPVCIRPSVAMGTSGTNEDDLTVKLADIIYINRFIADMCNKGAASSVIFENWDFLQQQVAMLINSDLPGFPKTLAMASQKPIRALTQRLKGKHGRFRGNLSGKRVDFSGRTVIGPDPNLQVGQVGVPEWVAMKMTFPEVVTPHNIDWLRVAVRNGPELHPGANFLESGSTGDKRMLKYGDRNQIAERLQVGDIVERHLCDGDVVLFNRQPSLHRISIMAHRARVLPWRTFRFNPCSCTPFNADFDGDEMNLHLPQTQEARAEAAILMSVQNNIQTPRDGTPLVTLLQDFLTASYLVSVKDVFYDRAQMALICTYFSDALECVRLPPPSIVKPIELWTGKQVFNMLLCPNEKDRPLVNLEQAEKNYTSGGVMCPRDGYIVFHNSELMCGNLGKSCLGGSKKGLIYVLLRDHGPRVAARIMSRLAKLCARWLGNRGFSIGIDDVTPPPRLVELKRRLLDEGYNACDKMIAEFERGELTPQPGCNEEETLESQLLGTLSRIRDQAGQACMRELPYHYNSPLIMSVCGSKGSPLNISQMVALVGQQAVSGSRIPNGFVQRTLPHFGRQSRTPAAKGFVQNSFYTGLTATEFFFHTMGGREGLVDTAVKTAETGYMQRRLMKALEDLCAHYDHSVRSSTSDVVQFIYGDDGLDPIMLESLGPVNFQRLMNNIRLTSLSTGEPDLNADDVRQQQKNMMHRLRTVCSEQFQKDVDKYISTEVVPMISGDARIFSITQSMLNAFYESCVGRYLKAKVEPGTAVGAIGAQSIGEPGTQMTLKTFHFAGVASMNVTLGVPRIKEIINATKIIKTPIITASLDVKNDERVARIIKGRIELTTLGGVTIYIQEVYSKAIAYVNVKIDLETISKLQLETSIDEIRNCIVGWKPLKLKASGNMVAIESNDTLRVYPPDNSPDGMLFSLQRLKLELPNVVIKGIPTVSRAVIKDAAGKGDALQLLVEGTNLREVMGTVGVDGVNTTSNHILEVEETLGIEAARQTIANEIKMTMEGHGLTVDARHVMLLADVMSYKGKILGITRFGISKMKNSVLMLASFEKTTDHLFQAAVRGSHDDIKGVSESIILGIPMPVGTGLFKVLARVSPAKLEPKPEPLLR